MTAEPFHLSGSSPLDGDSDHGAALLQGLNELLDAELDRADRKRADSPLFTFGAGRGGQTLRRREELSRVIGAVDRRLSPVTLELVATPEEPSLVTETDHYTVHGVRWSVFAGVDGEGLWVQPKGRPVAHVVALGDADWTPEAMMGIGEGLGERYQFARRLAEQGCSVVLPVLIDRSDTWSGNPAVRMTNQPHREFVYRMAFELGRHIIGYEVQKILALVDWFERVSPNPPVGVFGYGEGGLLALCAGALDTRIRATAVAGYFTHRPEGWGEPIYRNVWRRCRGHTDAEIAALISPRGLVVEASPGPVVTGPPAETSVRRGAAPGTLSPAPVESVKREVALARRAFAADGSPSQLVSIFPASSDPGAGSSATLAEFLSRLGIVSDRRREMAEGDRFAAPVPVGTAIPDHNERLKRQFTQLCEYTQQLAHASSKRREEYWAEADTSSPEAWARTVESYRRRFRDEVIGCCPTPGTPLDPRTRRVEENEAYDLYEVVLRIWTGVPNFGYLLVPKGIAADERRPAVVCQHGLGGYPQATINEDGAYHGYARRLAERGYVVYAPQNPYIGPAGHGFRVLQFKANALGWSLFSLIAVQHQRILDWLADLPFVDGNRIGFYGLSYGGKTAMRVPALLPRYALSICSGDFNEWLMKVVRTDLRMSYMFTGEYEIPEYNLGNTFNYAEMAALIFPRPFMVERGHHDGVSDDEWVAFEYAKVRRLYADLGRPDRTEIEYFQGVHEINGKGTFAFLDRFLGPVTGGGA